MVEAAFGIEGFQRRVRAAVERRIAAAHAEAARERRGFVGVARVLAQGVWHRPSSPSKREAGRGASALKRVAASSRKLLRTMVEALVSFRKAHRKAWEAFRRKLPVTFPSGTYKAWRWYGATRTEATFYAPSG